MDANDRYSRYYRYYRTLGLTLDASMDEVKQAHKDLVRVWHPDRFTDDSRLQLKAQEKLKEVNEAFEKIQRHLQRHAEMVHTPRSPSHVVPTYRPFPYPETERPWPPPVQVSEQQRARRRRNTILAGVGVLAIGAVIAFHPAVTERLFHSRSNPFADLSLRNAAGHPADNSASEGGDVASPSLPESRDPEAGGASSSAHRAFSIGSTQDEVLATQGTPTSIEGSRWLYDLSAVSFKDGKVDSFSNSSKNLHVEMKPTTDVSAALGRGYFSLGSRSDEVLAVEGTPTSAFGNRWMYDSSWLEFDEKNRVSSYSNISRNLHVELNPAGDVSAARARGYFTTGSAPDEVLAVQGTPTSVNGDRWMYDFAWVEFRNGKVESYSNSPGNLKVRVH